MDDYWCGFDAGFGFGFGGSLWGSGFLCGGGIGASGGTRGFALCYGVGRAGGGEGCHCGSGGGLDLCHFCLEVVVVEFVQVGERIVCCGETSAEFKWKEVPSDTEGAGN